MNKSRKTIQQIIKYLRELSIIIAGVSITVGVGLWINNNNSAKDQKQYFDAMILELKENAKNFDTYAKMLQKSVRYSNYINSHDEKSLHLDTIQYYAWSGPDGIGWGNLDPVILYNKDAFEMFKFSGAMRQVDDKDLLLSIMKVYLLMENIQNQIDGCLQYKKEVGMMDIKRLDDGERIVVRMAWFYRNNVPRNMVYLCEQTAEHIRETVSKLENQK